MEEVVKKAALVATLLAGVASFFNAGITAFAADDQGASDVGTLDRGAAQKLFPAKRAYSSYVPYIYSEAELKRLLAAVPAATAGSQYAIDADTLRALLLLLYGAGLRRGEAMRLKIEDVNISQSLIHIRGTKFFKTRIVPLSDSLNTVIRTFIAREGNHYSAGGESRLFSNSNGTVLSDTTVCVAFRR
jgi:site-specific recombinase XerD